ncbi:HD domain-containing protein [Haloferax sp. S1W]|uniref:HD domain-containing protein n=1 Tax=Haloferax sp. S1W TaxID=3377110 RepID=UPI0037CB353B
MPSEPERLSSESGIELQDIRSVARSYFRREVSPAHDWFHVQRVEANAEQLASEYPDVDDAVVRLSVLLHDIGRAKEDRGEIEDHAEWGAEESDRILREHGVSSDRRDAVAHCIRAHRYSNHIEPETLEAKILCDADNLDAIGAVGIARCFTYGGELGSPIHDPSLPVEADESVAGETQFNHLQKKLLNISNRMYTDAGRERASERTEFVRTFAQRFEREVAGNR